jgi:hypothetical protein
VDEWKTWTGTRFPETGGYVVPPGLAPVHVGAERVPDEYWEPNVWLVGSACGSLARGGRE